MSYNQARPMENMSGKVWNNTNRQTDKHPHMTGKCIINGQELRVSVWANQSRDGTQYFSLRFSEPMANSSRQNYVRPDAAYQSPQQSPNYNPMVQGGGGTSQGGYGHRAPDAPYNRPRPPEPVRQQSFDDQWAGGPEPDMDDEIPF